MLALATDLDRLQTSARAGAGNANAILEPEERAMRRAQNMLALGVDEPVRQPVERRAAMRAAIAVGDDPVAAAQHEDREAPLAVLQHKPLAAAIRNVGDAAEGTVWSQALMPAILQRSFHSASPTGTTERRD